MKRPALKFDTAAIGGFLLRHVEKFVVAFVTLACLGLVWGAVDAVRLQSVRPQQTPKAIQDQAEAARRHIEQSKPAAVAKLPQGRLTAAIDPWRPGRVKLADAPPAETAILDRPMFAELAKRGVPDVFPIEDLRAVAGVALVRDTKPAALAPAAPPEPEPKPGARGGTGGGRGRPREPQPPDASLPPDAAPAPFPGPDAAGEANVLEPFVVVSGLIPAQKQQAEFQRRFGNASLQQADRDMPRWGVYRVERCVVVPGGTPRWEPLKVTNVETRDRPGAAAAPAAQAGAALAVESEVLPKSFFLGASESEIGYSAALPQRLDDPWGAAAFHPWFLPRVKRLLAEDPAAAGGDGSPEERLDLAAAVAAAPKSPGLTLVVEGVTLVGEPQPQEKVKQLLALEARGGDGVPPVKAGPIGATEAPVFAISAEWGERLAFDGVSLSGKPCDLRVRIDMVGRTPVLRILTVEQKDAAGGGATLEELAPAPVGGAPGSVAGPTGTTPQERGLEYRLFRFVDLDVEAGRQYRYRVKFALRNPNFGLNQQHLAVAAAAKGEFLVSPYSNETPPISVPDPTAVLVRSIAAEEAKTLKLKPGMIEMLVLAGDELGGGLSLRSLVAEPGALVDVDAKLNKPGDTRCRGADVETGRILVDARGRQGAGEKADARSRRPPEPLELLVLQPRENTFEVVSLADSQPLVDRHRSTLPVVEDKRKDKPGRPGQPGAPPFDANSPFPGLPPR